ncbi:PilW family protein [Ramlibacter tataouinensis]|uniref:PilW family protein n=1 Tax=Ramlibacter tataouinensis TaxID=94132 RepID=UPI0022F3DB4B|nr:PilW family protein [Ramlibacter tataouinensis]WBY01579.1 PilW family protein [Ramlibacter tataouinensis]
MTESSIPLRGRRQAGLTLVEFMVAIVIGMLMVAAMAALIANQSTTRGEVDRSGKLIENGRYAIRMLAEDVQMAGYWGELSTAPDVPAALPDPCSTAVANLETAMGLAVQGYDAPATLPPEVAACVKNHLPGTDVLVVRKADPDTSAIETAGAMDLTKLKPGQVYLQTGLDTTSNLTHVLAAADPATDAATFVLKRKVATSLAALRKYTVHIYYISKCSVEESGSCDSADGGTPIPTLKRVELTVSGGAASMTCGSCTITIAEGIENMQIDYGTDTSGDGQPDGTDSAGSTFTKDNWADVMSLKIHLLARATERTPAHQDTKSYVLGVAGNVAAANDAYRRHVFVQSVRLVNPSARRPL